MSLEPPFLTPFCPSLNPILWLAHGLCFSVGHLSPPWSSIFPCILTIHPPTPLAINWAPSLHKLSIMFKKSYNALLRAYYPPFWELFSHYTHYPYPNLHPSINGSLEHFEHTSHHIYTSKEQGCLLEELIHSSYFQFGPPLSNSYVRFYVIFWMCD